MVVVHIHLNTVGEGDPAPRTSVSLLFQEFEVSLLAQPVPPLASVMRLTLANQVSVDDAVLPLLCSDPLRIRRVSAAALRVMALLAAWLPVGARAVKVVVNLGLAAVFTGF